MQSSIQARWHVVCVGFCMPALLGCTRAAPEQQLRATLEQMHQAIEACEIGTAMAPVAEDFVGENGLDAAGLRRLVQAQMLGNAQIGVTMGAGRCGASRRHCHGAVHGAIDRRQRPLGA